MLRMWMIVAAAILLASTAAAQAQNCCIPKMGEDAQSTRLIDGIYSATIVLLAVPYFLIGAVGVWIYRCRLKDSADKETERRTARRQSQS